MKSNLKTDRTRKIFLKIIQIFLFLSTEFKLTVVEDLTSDLVLRIQVAAVQATALYEAEL